MWRSCARSGRRRAGNEPAARNGRNSGDGSGSCDALSAGRGLWTSRETPKTSIRTTTRNATCCVKHRRVLLLLRAARRPRHRSCRSRGPPARPGGRLGQFPACLQELQRHEGRAKSVTGQIYLAGPRRYRIRLRIPAQRRCEGAGRSRRTLSSQGASALRPRWHRAASVERSKARDSRWRKRRARWNRAEELRERLANGDTTIDDIVASAKDLGFWSVWMTVFADHCEVRARLRDAFPGTRRHASGSPPNG